MVHLGTSRRRRKLAWRFGLGVLGLAAYLSTATMLAAPTASGETVTEYYCADTVPAYTDCADNPGNFWDWYDGHLNVNHAYLYGGTQGNGPSVCEHTYIYGSGSTASRRCDGGWVSSDSSCPGDNWYWYNHNIELSAHAGNSASGSRAIYGHGFVETEGPCD